jgi:hypothetical protein
MDLTHILYQCDQRAGFTWPWEQDFTPVGLLIYKDGQAEGVKVVDGTPIADVCMAIGRAAKATPKRLAAIGVICSGWASKSAPVLGIDPARATDRQRARVTYAADRNRIFHVYTNITGSTNYERILDPPEGIGTVLCDLMDEATGLGAVGCSTGQHERKMLL